MRFLQIVSINVITISKLVRQIRCVLMLVYMTVINSVGFDMDGVALCPGLHNTKGCHKEIKTKLTGQNGCMGPSGVVRKHQCRLQLPENREVCM